MIYLIMLIILFTLIVITLRCRQKVELLNVKLKLHSKSTSTRLTYWGVLKKLECS